MTMRRSGTASMTMSEGSINLEMPSSAKPSKACKKQMDQIRNYQQTHEKLSYNCAMLVTDDHLLITFLLLRLMSYGSSISKLLHIKRKRQIKHRAVHALGPKGGREYLKLLYLLSVDQLLQV